MGRLPASCGDQARHVDGPWDHLAAGQAMIQRLCAATVAVGKSPFRVTVQEVGDDMAIPAHLHHVANCIVEGFHTISLRRVGREKQGVKVAHVLTSQSEHFTHSDVRK